MAGYSVLVQEDSWIGRRIGQLRRERRWTLAYLADEVALSSTQLSRIESGARQSSVGTLIEIARAFGISLSELVEEVHESPYYLVRNGQREPRLTANGSIVSLSGPYSGLEALHLEIPAGSDAPEAAHDGEEWLYILAGTVEVTVAETELALETGDAIHYQAHTAHRVRNNGDQTAQLMLVATARTKGPQWSDR